MKDKSIWLDNIVKKKYPKLDKDIDCDILIIGSGITGLSCGYFLKNSKKRIILVEGCKICQETTAKSTGKLTYLQGDILRKINNCYDEKMVLRYLESQKEAIRLAKKIIIENKINCNLETASSYIFTKNKLNISNIKANYNLIKKDTNARIKKDLPINTKSYQTLEVNDTFTFHPVKFCLSLAGIISKDIEIYENTRITKIEKENNHFIAKTNNNLITTKEIILACHYPFFTLPFLFPMKTSIEKSFLVAGEINKAKMFSAINIDKDLLSIRYYKDKKSYLIMVSETGTLNKNIDNIKKKTNIIWKMRTNFTPNIKYCWSNYDIMTSDYLPYIGKIKDHLYIGTGYNTWGMTNGILAGKIISDLILKNDNNYQELFNPLRDEKNIPNIFKFNLDNGYSYIKSKINKKIYTGNNKIVKENNNKYGIYIDKNKKEHIVLNKCPHLGCSLSFNQQTLTWDCPCHGSRFDINGNILSGPAIRDIKK